MRRDRPLRASSCRASTRSRSRATTCARPGPRRRRSSRSPSRTRSRTCARRARPGLDPERVGERLSFFFACHSDFLEEVAKFRCARRLWARLTRDRLGITNPRAQQCRFHVQTGGVTLTAQQPDNNVVRVALQTLAAVLGGCQSLHTNAARRGARAADRGLGAAGAAHPADRRLRVGRRRHRRPARRQLRGRGRDRRARARRRCGSSTASRRRAARSRRSSAAWCRPRSRSRPTATSSRSSAASAWSSGVNRFSEAEEAPPGDILRIDPQLERAQVERVRALRARRAARAVGAARSTRSRRPRARAPTWCRRWSTRCWPGPRSGRSRAGCAACSASTGRRWSCEARPPRSSASGRRRPRRSRSCCPRPGSRSRPTSTRARRVCWGRATPAGCCGSAWRSCCSAGWRSRCGACPGSGAVQGLRETLPLVACLLIYTNLHDTIGFVNPHDVHDALVAADAWIFGVQPCVWAERFITPARTELMQFLLPELLLDRALGERAAARAAGAGASSGPRRSACIACFFVGYLLYVCSRPRRRGSCSSRSSRRTCAATRWASRRSRRRRSRCCRPTAARRSRRCTPRPRRSRSSTPGASRAAGSSCCCRSWSACGSRRSTCGTTTSWTSSPAGARAGRGLARAARRRLVGAASSGRWGTRPARGAG